jgi:hypothetical protein
MIIEGEEIGAEMIEDSVILYRGFGAIKIIIMRRMDFRSKEAQQINPEDNLSAPQSISLHSNSNQLREEKLNAELLRIKTQYLQKYV